MARRYAIEDDYYYRQPRRRVGLTARLLPFVFGVVAGLALAAMLLAYPETVAYLWQEVSVPFNRLSEEKQQVALASLAIAGIAALALARNLILSSGALFGIVVGMTLWVPFGRQMIAAVPQIDEQLPTLSAGLNAFVESEAAFGQIRAWGENAVPVPEEGS